MKRIGCPPDGQALFLAGNCKWQIKVSSSSSSFSTGLLLLLFSCRIGRSTPPYLLGQNSPLCEVSVGTCRGGVPHNTAWHCSLYRIRYGALLRVRSVKELVRSAKPGMNQGSNQPVSRTDSCVFWTWGAIRMWRLQFYPSVDAPPRFPSGTPNTVTLCPTPHFLGLAVSPARPRNSRTADACLTCSAQLSLRMMMSSK